MREFKATATPRTRGQTQHANAFDEMPAQNFPGIILQGIKICTVPANVQGLRHAMLPNSPGLLGGQAQNLTPDHKFVETAFKGAQHGAGKICTQPRVHQFFIQTTAGDPESASIAGHVQQLTHESPGRRQAVARKSRRRLFDKYIPSLRKPRFFFHKEELTCPKRYVYMRPNHSRGGIHVWHWYP